QAEAPCCIKHKAPHARSAQLLPSRCRARKGPSQLVPVRSRLWLAAGGQTIAWAMAFIHPNPRSLPVHTSPWNMHMYVSYKTLRTKASKHRGSLSCRFLPETTASSPDCLCTAHELNPHGAWSLSFCL